MFSGRKLLRLLGRVAIGAAAGFAAGLIAPLAVSWAHVLNVHIPHETVDIANTYIVFTTFIFVVVSVFLAIIGYIFAQQFAQAKRTHQQWLFEELAEKAKDDDMVATKMIDAILHNADAKRMLQSKISSAVEEAAKERFGSEGFDSSPEEREQSTRELASQLRQEEKDRE